MTIAIKKMEEQDWKIVRSIRLQALKSDPSVFGSNFQKESDYLEEEWRGRLRNNDSATFVIFLGDTAIGMTGIAIDRNDAHKRNAFLWGSWLVRDYRGQGLSQMMYEARLNWAVSHGSIEKIIVSHRASNLASKHANQKHGFVFTHAKAKDWPDGVHEDEIYYELFVKSVPN